MKLSKYSLIRIVEIVRLGLTENKDISQALRDLDLVVDGEGRLTPQEDQQWAAKKPS
jgi:glycerate kinase